MTAQYRALVHARTMQPARNRNRPWLHSISVRLLRIYDEAKNRADKWALERRIARSRLAIQALPEHIRQDIGWPATDDCPPVAPPNRS